MPADTELDRPLPFRLHRARRGFTLIEMLVVIGIILLLIGMSITGFTQIAKHGKTQHTKAAVETAKAIVSEYEATAGKQALATFKSNYDTFPRPIDATSTAVIPVVKFLVPGTAAPQSLTWREYSAVVLAKFLEMPNNKAILDKLPVDQIGNPKLQIPAGSGNYFYEILDGFGHPILFVPTVGLSKVTAGGQAPGYLQNDGRVTAAGGTAPNPRYFWMSAGADGQPSAGDDNVYSFDQ